MSLKIRSHTFKTRAPFGVATKRFEGFSVHPNLDPIGNAAKRAVNLSPGQYNPQLPECLYKKYNVNASSWKRKSEVEEFSQNLGFRNTHILKERRFQLTLGGPGHYEISEEIYKRQTSSCKKNVGFSTQKRFWNPLETNYPPPGTYTRDGSKPFIFCKHSSKLPTFEWDGFVNRFKDDSPPYRKPPNLYDPIDTGSINALLNKKVSKRGPYDLFTGPRDESTIKNHFGRGTFRTPDCVYTYPNELHILLHHPSKARVGKFLQEARFSQGTLRNMIDDPTLCRRNPNDPSPCHYFKDMEIEIKLNKYPFNKSSIHARPPTKWIIHPGVGRYDPKYSACKGKTNRESWIFKSKSKRTEYKPVEYNAF